MKLTQYEKLELVAKKHNTVANKHMLDKYKKYIEEKLGHPPCETFINVNTSELGLIRGTPKPPSHSRRK